MAADTRPYKSKEQDGQGNEVIIRDQQLVEQSTVTTMPSGACFETLDIDGRHVKIPRDNMMSIVLECIGIVLNDSSKNLGTNVNKALGLQGNTIGNVTVNDFASVLGDRLNIWHGKLELNQSITLPTKTWKGGLLIKTTNTGAGYNVDIYPVKYYGTFSETSGSLTISRSADSGPVTLTATGATTLWAFIGIGD